MAEPLNATFFAFRKREKAGVLTRAAIATAVIATLLFVGFVAAFWSAIGPVIAWYGQLLGAAASQDEAAIAGMTLPAGLGAMVLGVFVLVFAVYVLFAAFEAACLRWMIHGEESGGFMGLSLSAPTWRVYSGYWVWFGLYMAFSMVMSIAMVSVMMLAFGIGGVPSSQDPTSGLVWIPLFYLVFYGAMIFFAVRLAPAAAASIARRKFAFFDAWKITKGRFWALFGAFFLLALIYMIFVVLIWTVMFVAVLAPLMPQLGAISATDPQGMVNAEMQVMQAFWQAFLQPSTWAVLGGLQLAGLAIAMVFYVAWFGVNARAAQAALSEGKITAAA